MEKVDDRLFSEYVSMFGMIDVYFSAPDITANKLESLMKKAIKTGKEIPYKEEGWYDPGPDAVL